MMENPETLKNSIATAIRSGDANKLQEALKAWLGPATKDTLSESLKQAGNETRKPA